MSTNIFEFSKIVKINEQIPVVNKIVNGTVIQCIDIDNLSPTARERYFTGEIDKALANGTARTFIKS